MDHTTVKELVYSVLRPGCLGIEEMKDKVIKEYERRHNKNLNFEELVLATWELLGEGKIRRVVGSGKLVVTGQY